MIARFADTFHFLALLSAEDSAHEAAWRYAAELGSRIVTTDWVVIEIADALSSPAQRGAFLPLWEEIRDHPAIEIIPADRALLLRGLDLYSRGPDKAWSLTDCLSFVAMADRGLTDALTGDHHFEQAGFRASLRNP